MYSVNCLNIKSYIFIASYIIICLFLISIDSFTHDLYIRDDSAIYFMSGKAWMNGLVPYTDFADSKGPLLWLIYGIAYLLSPYNYLGVFFVHCIAYIFVFIVVFKILKLYFNNEAALSGTLLSSLFIFFPTYFNQARAEHFCHPFIIMGLYMLLSSMKGTAPKYKYGILMGISIVGCFMIKWTIAFEMCSFACCLSYLAFKNKTTKYYVVGLMIGILLLLIPFGVYFAIAGNFDDFIKEYFLNTYNTVKMPIPQMLGYYFLYEIPQMLVTLRVLAVIYILPALFIFKTEKTNDFIVRYMPFACALFFVMITAKHCINNHYINSCSLFSVFVVIWIMQRYKTLFEKHLLIFAVCILSLTLGGHILVDYKKGFANLYTSNSQYMQDFYKASFIVGQIDNARILNFGGERGIGMAGTSTLPACKYWTQQIGATEQMLAGPLKTLYNKEADFVVCSPTDVSMCKNIKKAGYNPVMSSLQYGKTYDFMLFSKHHNLIMPPASFKVTKLDVLFKQSIRNKIFQTIDNLK